MERTFTFYAVTYGCRVNQYETQSIREWWQSLGGQETDDPAEADVILVDSCAVTAEAVSDARQMTRKLGRVNPHARIFAAGCAASAEPADFDLPGVAAVIAQKDKFVLFRSLLEESLKIPFPCLKDACLHRTFFCGIGKAKAHETVFCVIVPWAFKQKGHAQGLGLNLWCCKAQKREQGGCQKEESVSYHITGVCCVKFGQEQDSNSLKILHGQALPLPCKMDTLVKSRTFS